MPSTEPFRPIPDRSGIPLVWARRTLPMPIEGYRSQDQCHSNKDNRENYFHNNPLHHAQLLIISKPTSS